QVQEFSVFTGRLTRGLDPLIDYIGWGLPVSTPTPTSTPTTVATSTPVTTVSLANTGSGVEVSNLLTVAVVISTVGALIVLRSRKRNRVNY
ncbi:MAG: LPXTG cell wall anchor domain-containing protein, partial [Actinomycetota bacterium]